MPIHVPIAPATAAPPARGQLLFRALATGALFGLLAWISIELTRGGSRIAALWLPNAAAAAMILRSPFGDWRGRLAACVGANLAVVLALGGGFGPAAGLAAANGMEIAIFVLSVQRTCGQRPELDDFRTLGYLLLSSVTAPLAAGIVPAACLAGTPGAFATVYLQWVATDTLGFLTVTPFVFIAVDTWRRRYALDSNELREWFFIATGAVVVCGIVFTQTRFPFLLPIGAIVVLAAFRTGIVGTALTLAIVTIISSTASFFGIGPIMLVEGDLAAKVVALQLVLAINLGMGLPIATVLSGYAKTRDDLRSGRDFTQSILDNIQEIIFRTDADGCWVFLNPAWETITGYPVAQSLGWRTTQLLHPDSRAEAVEVYPRLVAGDCAELTLQQVFRHASGENRHVEVRVRRLCANGVFIGTTGNIRDITDRVRQERALLESETRFRRMAEAAPVGIYRASEDGALTYLNPAWSAKVGLTPGEALDEGWKRRLDAAMPFEEGPAFFGKREPGEIRRRVLRFRDAHGDLLYGETMSAAEYDADGNIVGYIGVINDVTAQRAAEAELVDARVRAEAGTAAKSAFLANMSHEIRTPMNGVLGFIDLLAASPLDAEQQRYVQLIADSGHAMMRLLNDILDLSKIESGRMHVAEDAIDLAHKLRNCAALLAPLAERKGIALSVDIDPELPPRVIGDALRLRQIVLNLLGNAVKFTTVGEVALRAYRAGDRLVIAVRDTGIGIPVDRHATIFDHFAQADGSISGAFGGSGLGLAISADLAGLMDGSITVDSAPGAGSTFRLDLPLAPAMTLAVPAAVATARATAVVPLATPARRYRVLVAEDHDVNQLLMTELARRLDFDITIVGDGAQAVTRVAQAQDDGAPFDLVLMDIQMPRMGGCEAARRIRALGIDAATLPIIALTAHAYEEEVAGLLSAGMQRHLAKPVRIADLRSAMAECLGSPPAQNERDAISVDTHAIFESYERQCRCALDLLVASGDPHERIERSAIVDCLHNLAGTAGLFGDADLSAAAARLEAVVRRSPSSYSWHSQNTADEVIGCINQSLAQRGGNATHLRA